MKPLRIYLSSTFQDLEEYRTKVFSALERAGLLVARMEGYTAADERPMDLCLRDVATADIYLGIFAWRYGYIPPAHHGNTDGRSISELEYRHAQSLSRPTLMFLTNADTKTNWPSQFNDEITGEANGGAKLTAFRAEIATEKTVSMFRTPDELATLVLASLMRTGSGGRPYNIPSLRPGVVPRPALMKRVLTSLLPGNEHANSHTLIWGGGGFGKTTLAIMGCHVPELVNAFPDGMLWTTLGEHPDLAKALSDLYVAVAGEPPGATRIAGIAEALAKLLEHRRCLIVVDDVWRSDDLSPFLSMNGPHLLVTSRVRNLLMPFSASQWCELAADDMEPDEAASLLARGLVLDDSSHDLIINFAEQLSCWPLLLQLANARLLEECKNRLSVAQAIERVMTIYSRKGVLGFDRRDSAARNAAVQSSVMAGLAFAEMQSPGVSLRAAELAIFPEDTAVPVRVLAELWNVDVFDAEEDTLRVLHNLSVIEWERTTGDVRLHDMVRAALATQLPDADAVHARLVDAWKARDISLTTLPHEYAWRHIAYHLTRSNRQHSLQQLLSQFKWLRAKLNATDVAALIADFDGLEPTHPLQLVKGALRLASPYLWIDKSQLPSQVAGRLPLGVHAEIDALLEQLGAWRDEPWLRPLRSTLHLSGGALERVFRGYAGGHRGTVRSIAIDGTGKWAVSAGNSHPDQCLIVWSLATGTQQKLEQQALAGGVTPLAMSRDGKMFVSGYEGELRAWRRGESAPFAVAAVAEKCVVDAVSMTDDGLQVIASASDGIISIWEPLLGRMTLLGTHEPRVLSLAVAPDGAWAVSMNGDDARLWDVVTRNETARWLTPGFSPVRWSTRQVDIAEDGLSVVWMSHSNTGVSALQRWNRSDDEIVSTLCDQTARGLFCVHAERRRAIAHTESIGSAEGYGLLTFATDPALVPLADIGRGISGAAISRDGSWAITADYEHDLMVWNLDRAVAASSDAQDTFVPWRGRQFDQFVAAGRYAAFGFDDERPFVWDVETNLPVRDEDIVAEIIATEIRRRTSALETRATSTADNTAKTGLLKKKSVIDVELDARARGHTATILCRALSPDARFEATAAEDGTVRVWDIASQRVIAVFSDETIFHNCVWGEDGLTLAVTDYRKRTHLLRFLSHTIRN